MLTVALVEVCDVDEVLDDVVLVEEMVVVLPATMHGK